MIYLDNAATTRRKPDAVYDAMDSFMREVCASPGRSSHRLAVESGRIIFEAREALAQLFNMPDSSRIAFSANATQAINIALHGMLRGGGRVLTTSMEHNSVMRPLRYLAREKSIEVTVIKADRNGFVDVEEFAGAVRENTRLAVVNHASNVVGTILDIEKLGSVLAEKGVPLVVDAAQTAGALPIDFQKSNISVLAFTGHKALFGPPGVGGLCVARDTDIVPVFRGGTGSQSEREEQPDFMPDMLECGTPNTVGVAGLLTGVEFVLSESVEKIRAHEQELTQRLLDGLGAIPAVTIYGPCDPRKQTATVSINISGKQPSEVAEMLEDEFDIAVRVGLQCAPAAHKTIGTFPAGTVRISMSYFTTAGEVDTVIKAVEEVSGR